MKIFNKIKNRIKAEVKDSTTDDRVGEYEMLCGWAKDILEWDGAVESTDKF